MSVVGLGMIGSFAATSAVQRYADKDRTAVDTVDQSLRNRTQASAENAGGIGEPEQEQAIGDRDADGRRAWELPRAEDEADAATTAAETLTAEGSSLLRGDCGSKLDVVG